MHVLYSHRQILKKNEKRACFFFLLVVILKTVGAIRQKTWGISSAGRAPHWQCGGQRFDPAMLHQSRTFKKRFGFFFLPKKLSRYGRAFRFIGVTGLCDGLSPLGNTPYRSLRTFLKIFLYRYLGSFSYSSFVFSPVIRLIFTASDRCTPRTKGVSGLPKPARQVI